MIVQIIGWFCLVLGILNFIGGLVSFNKGDIDESRWSALYACLLFIAAVICFK